MNLKSKTFNNAAFDFKVHKYTLLLGAGFTKNFGGLTGKEMWSVIFTDKNVRNNSKLQKMMKDDKESNYEKVYSEVMKSDLCDEDKGQFHWAVVGAYNYIDRMIGERFMYHKHVSIGKVNHNLIVDHFMGRDEDKGFIFTLNQDLLFERHFGNSPEPRMPYLTRPNRKRLFGGYPWIIRSPKEDPDAFVKLPTEDEINNKNIVDELTPLNYLKLHGSFNFHSCFDEESSTGWRKMVIGTNKEEEIAREPVLKKYKEIFDYVLGSKSNTLVIIGYGFSDGNINDILQKHMQKGLKVHIIDPRSPDKLRDMLIGESGQKYSAIWNNFEGYYQFSLKNLFPNAPDETPELSFLRESLFGIKSY